MQIYVVYCLFLFLPRVFENVWFWTGDDYIPVDVIISLVTSSVSLGWSCYSQQVCVKLEHHKHSIFKIFKNSPTKKNKNVHKKSIERSLLYLKMVFRAFEWKPCASSCQYSIKTPFFDITKVIITPSLNTKNVFKNWLHYNALRCYVSIQLSRYVFIHCLH